MTDEQTTDAEHPGAWTDAIADAVASVSPSVVRVVGRRRRTGTGFAWSDDLIVTTRRLARSGTGHVVTDDGTRHEATVVGSDRGTGIAVLRTKASLAAVEQRGLDGVSVGLPGVALGRPGAAIRASLRIVGAIGPEVTTPRGGRLEHYVETDRTLPRGFGGGPLVDLEGRVLGMNTRGPWPGTDLVIPNVTLARVVGELTTHGRVRRGWLGVGIYPVRVPRGAATSHDRGAMIVALEDDGPAATAGLMLGDVILEVDGAQTRSPRELARVLLDRPDRDIVATVLRAGAVDGHTLHTGVSG